jgi:nicotinate phosphoribosyltransferase
MVDAAIQSGTADRECMFETFARRLPDGRRYGVVAGTGRLLEQISKFRFTDEELSWLRDNHVVRQPDARLAGELLVQRQHLGLPGG